MRQLEQTEQKELLGFSMIALLFVFPIIQANITFADDTTRVIVGYPGWAFLGRPLATLTSIFSSLGWIEKGILDIGAWAQIMAAALLAFSAFVFNLYLKREHTQKGIFCLAVILIINPYFLYNLSYRFDALAMSLGFFCTVYAFCLPIKHRCGSIKSVLILIAALSLYQSDINIFIALTAIELLLLSPNNTWREISYKIITRATQYCLALIIYYLTIAKIFMANNHGRNNLVSLDSAGWHNITDNISHYFSTASDFFSPPVAILMAVFALICVFQYLRFVVQNNNQLLLICAPLLALFMYCIALSGPMFLLAENTASFRTMPAFFTFVAMLIALSFSARKQFSYSWLIPVYIAITLSFQYGIAAKSQRDYEVSIATMIHKHLLDAKSDTIPTYVSGSMARAPRTKNLANSHPFIAKTASPTGGWVARAFLIGQGLESIVYQWPQEFAAYEPTLRNDFCVTVAKEVTSNTLFSIYHSNNSNLILLNSDRNSFCKA